MTGWTWVEPFAGAAACALRLVGGRGLTPAVSWMGSKRRLAGDILGAMGVPAGRPSRVLLGDAGPWGWVWPLLLKPENSARVAAVLRSWAGEHHRALWDRLFAEPPREDLHERAAQWLWLQSRAASGVPMWWSEWLDGGRGRWEQGSGEGRPPQPAGQRGTWRMGEEQRKSRRGDRGASQKGTSRDVGGMSDPRTIADRLDAIALAAQAVSWDVFHGRAEALVPHLTGPTWALLDPDYQGATGYGWTCSRPDVVSTAIRWAMAGAVVGVCEAVPLTIPGWHALELTREGGKPEWLTMSRAPARLPERQASLFSEGA
jgi:hypothetical protein